MPLGPYTAFNGVSYECRLCSRYFNTRDALLSHCRYTSHHEWCETCRRVFVSPAAKAQHLSTSLVHNYVCTWCDHWPLFRTESGLTDHRVLVHNLCVFCLRYFNGENSLRMHQQIHQPRNLECYGCTQPFKSFAGMMIHLESGSCFSGSDINDINNLARQCRQRQKYLNSDGCYFCSNCDREFSKLSSLFQHVETTPACSHLTESGQCLFKLKNFISFRVARSLFL